MSITNNILWGNTASAGNQIYNSGSAISVTYNDIQGGYYGLGNIHDDPCFSVPNYYLSIGSPCIDQGDSTFTENDIQDPLNPSVALFPSMGNLRNDMGAYGGPWCSLLSGLSEIYTGSGYETCLRVPPEILIMPNPIREEANIVLHLSENKELCVKLFDMTGRMVRSYPLEPAICSDYRIRFSKGDLLRGCYWLVLISENYEMVKKALIIN